MSHVTDGQNGVRAVQDKDYDKAIALLTKATDAVKSPVWLLALAQAYQHKNEIQKALASTQLGYRAALERANRKLMIDAQYRRAVLLYKLGRYADADCCARWSQMLIDGRRPSELASYPDVDAVDGESGLYKVTLEQVKMGEGGMSQAPQRPNWDTVQSAMGGAGDSSHKKRSPEWNRAFQWRIQVLGALEKLPPNNLARKVNVTPVDNGEVAAPEPEVANVSEPEAARAHPAAAASQTRTPQSACQPGPGDVGHKAGETEKLMALRPRVDFYQTNKSVSVSLYIKNVNKETLRIEYDDMKVVIGPLALETEAETGQYWLCIVTPDTINRAASRHTVFRTKVELVLEKGNPGARWPSWGTIIAQRNRPDAQTSLAVAPEDEGTHLRESSSSKAVPADVSAPAVETGTPHSTGAGALPTDTDVSTAGIATSPAIDKGKGKSKAPAGPPAYPTSSKHGPKDWDRLEVGDAAEDDSGDVNEFFKKLYAGATPEQQRAMMKSFTESNGTALSTDWNDVRGRRVETVPPDGVEAKKWEG